MRRRRQVLQVSTFPFLAVLLCAMGSLILLLLVIDRRARVVARVRAMRALEQVDAEEARRVDAARRAAALRAAAERAEWERRRQALHNQLAEEDGGLLTQLQVIEARARAAAGRSEEEKAQAQTLRGKLQAEHARLLQVEATLRTRKAELERKGEETALTQAELARLASELSLMERTVADLKAARQRQQQTYSLVPYRGRRGDNRRPIYVECAADGLVFHPDRRELRGVDLSLGGIRDEVERRIAAQRGTSADRTPYLLMLIRPDGIDTYGRTLVALRGVKVDFGYEFVDADWVLDFPNDDETPGSQPWMAAGQTNVPPPSPGQKPSGPSTRLVGLRSSLDPRFGTGSSEGDDGRHTGGPGPGVAAGLGRPVPGLPGMAGGTGGPGPGFSGTAGRTGGLLPGGTLESGPGHVGLPSGSLAGAGYGRGLRSGPGPGLGGSPPGSLVASAGPVGISGPAGETGSSAAGVTRPAGLGPGAPGSGGGPGSSAAGGTIAAGPGTGAPGSGGGPGSSAAGGTSAAGPGTGAPGSGGGPGASTPGGTRPAGPGTGAPGSGGERGASTPGGVSPGGPGSAAGTDAGPSGTAGNGPGGGAGMAPGQGPSGGAPPSPVPTGFRPVGDPPVAAPSSGSPAFAPGAGTGSSAGGPAGAAPGASASGTPGAGPAGSPSSGETAGGDGSATGQGVGAVGSGPRTGGRPSAAGSGGGSDQAPGEGGSGQPGRANPLLAMPGSGRASRSESRPTLVLISREWDLWVECTADAVVVYPSRLRFPAESLSAGASGNGPLSEAVRQMIARKQATVRPGEPPYEPRIRFLICPPGGLRTYYLAYPLLQGLQVPMSRENLDTDEDVYKHMYGR